MENLLEIPLSPQYVMRWHVPVDGFEWQTVSGEFWLVPQGERERVYPLRRTRRLLDEFTRLGSIMSESAQVLESQQGVVQLDAHSAKDAVLAFAKRRGMLTDGEPLAPAGSNPVDRVFSHFGEVGEPYSLWLEEASTFAGLRRLWGAIYVLRTLDAHDTPEVQRAQRLIRERVMWKPGGPLGLRGRSGRGPARTIILPKDPAYKKLVTRLKPESGLVDSARYLVQWVVNEKLQNAVRVAVHPFMDSAMRLWPRSLLGAIYLLFAAEMAGSLAVERWCEFCHIEPLTGRSHQQFCSDSCRYNNWTAKNPKKAAAKRKRQRRRIDAV